MKDTTRIRVAAVVGAAGAQKKVSAVYDYAAGSYKNASAEFSNNHVNGFDYSTSSHFSGGSNNSLDFFDYENSAHVQLKLDGENFNGFDYDTQSHFSGTIRGNSVTIFDHQTGQYYNYSVQRK